MDWFPFIIAWVALVVCGFYLHLKHRKRLCNWVPRDNPEKWTGHGLDTSQLTPRVEAVRQQHTAFQQAPRNSFYHRGLLAFARRTVLQLGYFQHQEPEEHAPLNGT
jgi:hypothetical protein